MNILTNDSNIEVLEKLKTGNYETDKKIDSIIDDYEALNSEVEALNSGHDNQKLASNCFDMLKYALSLDDDTFSNDSEKVEDMKKIVDRFDTGLYS